MEKKEEIPKVTKEKSPGRVAAGKRLAESNRLKRLEEKNKQYKEKIIHEETKEEEPQNKTIEKPTEINIYKTSTLLLLVAAGGGLYFGNKIFQKWRKPETIKPEIKETIKPDPFCME